MNLDPVALQTVANNSKKQGELYSQCGNFGRAFAHLLLALKLHPQWKQDLKDLFITNLCEWGNFLEQQKRYKDLFLCYEQALEVLPDSEEILNNLGAHLFSRKLSKQFHATLTINLLSG